MLNAFLFATTLSILGLTASQATSAAEYAARWKAFSTMDRATILQQADLDALLRQFADAGAAYRRDIEAANAQGRQPRACPPDRITFSTDDFVEAIDRLAPDEREEEMEVVFGRILDDLYPCTASA